jgi:DNA-binding sugar fermentation-stimulating protein
MSNYSLKIESFETKSALFDELDKYPASSSLDFVKRNKQRAEMYIEVKKAMAKANNELNQN